MYKCCPTAFPIRAIGISYCTSELVLPTMTGSRSGGRGGLNDHVQTNGGLWWGKASLLFLTLLERKQLLY